MPPSLLKWLQSILILAPLAVDAQSSGASPSTSFRPIFTVPASADFGETLLPNIQDSQAVDAQNVCPGYQGSNVQYSDTGLTADLTLAGAACNIYGTDIESLSLTVEYQTDSRLHVQIVPSYVDSSNESYYILSPEYVAKPSQQDGSASGSDLTFSWSNDPSFSFEVTRNSTGDVIFSTTGSQLVFENQFLELVTTQPENYHVYGLGEVIHSLDLGNNFTSTIYAADVGDPIDRNLYSSHPFALETRWYETHEDGSETLVTSNDGASTDASYTSYSHGVYLRNAHGQEVLMRPENITWRTIGGSIDLYFFSGPSQPEVTKQYQDVVGYPARQQYFTFGFHQCRWGYANWSEVEDVVNTYTDFGIPLENIWTDIDYMNQYRDFDNDPIRYDYETGQAFLQRLHDGGRHYIPIIDAAIYVPNPENASDAYETFDRGNATGSWLLNPDGSTYIGDVWPGKVVILSI
jgi:alpha-glucosidase